MNSVNTIEISLSDLDLEAAAGGQTVTCTTTETTVTTPKGILVVGTTGCGNGPAIPYAVWTPAR